LTASVFIFFIIIIITGHHCGWHIVKWTKQRIHQYKGAEAEKAM